MNEAIVKGKGNPYAFESFSSAGFFTFKFVFYMDY